MIKKFNLLLVTFFGIGYFKYAPGTLASLITTIILYYLLNSIENINIWLYFLIPLIFLYSLYAINDTREFFEEIDSKKIVIDEVVGQSIPIIYLSMELNKGPNDIFFYLIAFILFRIFDITKFLGFSIDKNMKNSLGVMLDDVIAGIYSMIVLIPIYAIKFILF